MGCRWKISEEAVGRLNIASHEMECEIAALGGELVRLHHRVWGDLLWPGIPNIWENSSPLLFPIVGRVRDGRITLGGQSFAMLPHGFAKDSHFVVLEKTDSVCCVILQDSALTQGSYPFQFRLEIRYQVQGARLSVLATIVNPSDVPLPASFGFHPGFRWPLDPTLRKTDYFIKFDSDEELIVSRISDGLLSNDTSTIALVNHKLPLDESLFDKGAMILRNLKSRKVLFAPNEKSVALGVSFDGLPQLGLWMRPGGDFLCIEPWHGYSDPVDFVGDFHRKPGIMIIPAGCAKKFQVDIDVLAAGPSDW